MSLSILVNPATLSIVAGVAGVGDIVDIVDIVDVVASIFTGMQRLSFTIFLLLQLPLIVNISPLDCSGSANMKRLLMRFRIDLSSSESELGLFRLNG